MLEMDVLWGPKAGAEVRECRDAAVLDESVRDRGGRSEARAVVCDGATVGLDTGRWARSLAAGLADAPPSAWTEHGFRRIIAELRGEWWSAPPRFASMYHEQAWRRGASATVAAVSIEPDRHAPHEDVAGHNPRGAALRTLTVGDSLIALVRDGQLVQKWPEMSAGDFTTTPQLLSTAGEEPEVELGRARVEIGDMIVVMTDAVAQWALRAATEGEPVWKVLGAVSDQRFRDLVHELRAVDEIVDDDVTVARLHYRPRRRSMTAAARSKSHTR